MPGSGLSSSSRGKPGHAGADHHPKAGGGGGGGGGSSSRRGSTVSITGGGAGVHGGSHMDNSKAAEKQSENAEKDAEKKEREIGRELQKMYDKVLEIIESETVTHAVVSAEGIRELEGKPPGKRDASVVAVIAKQIKRSPLYTFLPQVRTSTFLGSGFRMQGLVMGAWDCCRPPRVKPREGHGL
jgi:hypothetical protein